MRKRLPIHRRLGMAVVYIGFGLTALTGVCTFAVDLGRVHLAKSELQAAADAAARHACSAIGSGVTVTQDRAIFAAAQNTAVVGSRPINAAISSCDLNVAPASAPARCGNDLPASSPGELSDITPASVKFGWPRMRRMSSPDT